jgi:predicted RNase H-like HicB family nuclease
LKIKDVTIKDYFSINTLVMKRIIQVKIYRGEKYYVSECLDLPVVSQGKTLDKAVEKIKKAIRLHLDGEDLKGGAFRLIFQF